jgi:hypothetical protein
LLPCRTCEKVPRLYSRTRTLSFKKNGFLNYRYCSTVRPLRWPPLRSTARRNDAPPDSFLTKKNDSEAPKAPVFPTYIPLTLADLVVTTETLLVQITAENKNGKAFNINSPGQVATVFVIWIRWRDNTRRMFWTVWRARETKWRISFSDTAKANNTGAPLLFLALPMLAGSRHIMMSLWSPASMKAGPLQDCHRPIRTATATSRCCGTSSNRTRERLMGRHHDPGLIHLFC